MIESGRYILGEGVETFEKEFAKYIGVKHCIGVASGLDALTLSLKAYKFKKNSEVLVPSNTYIATILSIINCNLKPVLVEPNIETYNIEVEEIEKKITSKTVAILPVHLYGRPCNMLSIMELARRKSLKVIEDCAQAHGAFQDAIRMGSFGIGCFSFYPTKNLGCLGDGGAITTNDTEFYNEIIKLRNYGRINKYENDIIGFNSRLDDIQARFLSVKLPYLNKINMRKRDYSHIYRDTLKNCILPLEDYGHIYHIFNIRVKNRDKIKQLLMEDGVQTEIHYPIPPHKQNAIKKFFKEEYPIASEIHATTLSLPISYGHTQSEIEKVASLCLKHI